MGHVELIAAAADQQSVVANLLELYIHDFTEFLHVELGPDGRFAYTDLPLYWSEPDRYPFLIKVEGELAGLALVKKGRSEISSEVVWDVGEFFVVRGYRRKGIGAKAAHELWTRLPGSWEVRVMQSNRAALNFWQHAVNAFKHEVIEPLYAYVDKSGKSWDVFAFESEPVIRLGSASTSSEQDSD
ncbi:MAG: GNAT family N-acetyltransferase [Acidobacteriaceae bacterium]|nr:GNAT family N-acetyltransferase [Acidobacteriaceae bacterium]MBV9763544.1 GNAT family N-acetyltransferase [Acidobacteriaceae bacterium]